MGRLLGDLKYRSKLPMLPSGLCCAGHVLTYKKSQWSRLAVEGIQEALLDVMLLADCPVLIGTYYSSYSETAKMMGWPFYVQVNIFLRP